MTVALYPGSFDPITFGHLDILESGTKLFDKVIIAVSNNINKNGFLPVKDRIELIKQCTSDFKNIEIVTYEGLTVSFAQKAGADVILRGLRNAKDFEYELELAQTNNALVPNIKTLFLMTKAEHSFISSSAVRELCSYKGDITKFVPKPVEQYLYHNV